MHAPLITIRSRRNSSRPVERVGAGSAVGRGACGGPGVEREERGEVEREEGEERGGEGGEEGSGGWLVGVVW